MTNISKRRIKGRFDDLTAPPPDTTGMPEDVAERKIREHQEKKQRVIHRRKELTPLLHDLENVGIVVDDVWDLVNTNEDYLEAVPVLIRHLELPYSEGNKEGIVRALTVKAARPDAIQPLLRQFRNATDNDAVGLKAAIANALDVVADKSVMDDLIALSLDSEHGPARADLVRKLARWKRDPRAQHALEHLVDDPYIEVGGRARKALGK
ncbi:hypothetical protein QWY84_01985 [Aquisalimonas lutea]|uniref:HEAT repeat domain-containing protein n=1 Tax=Aquisalimonas lutea TaxID=1327750 RepID=UPI0025B578E9|nr:hypothetical protein [Aquisalimonas lutea]MDN3516369.1 hypothetical protein [Aquisalimonas lutea]